MHSDVNPTPALSHSLSTGVLSDYKQSVSILSFPLLLDLLLNLLPALVLDVPEADSEAWKLAAYRPLPGD